jgi:uncharacterized protein YabN with tetrapyrrole methylase and pyrophosphatase domain
VFADGDAETAGDVVRTWEQIKKDERGSPSLVDALPAGLPALLYVHKLFRKAASVGLEPTVDPTTGSAARLAAAVLAAQAEGTDAESALRGWAVAYRERFRRMEQLAHARGESLDGLDRDTVASLWAEAAP